MSNVDASKMEQLLNEGETMSFIKQETLNQMLEDDPKMESRRIDMTETPLQIPENESIQLDGDIVDDEFNDKYDVLMHNRQGESMVVDVYDVLIAFEVNCPIMSHLSKKSLKSGNRGHKSKLQDLYDIRSSINRAIAEELRKLK